MLIIYSCAWLHNPPPLPHFSGTTEIGNLCNDKYCYMSELLALEATATNTGPLRFKPATPLVLSAWQQAFKEHPDQAFVHYILSGLSHGFHIGADRAYLSLHPGPGNLTSVSQQPQLVEAHIAEEVGMGRLIVPLLDHLASQCHCSQSPSHISRANGG